MESAAACRCFAAFWYPSDSYQAPRGVYRRELEDDGLAAMPITLEDFGFGVHHEDLAAALAYRPRCESVIGLHTLGIVDGPGDDDVSLRHVNLPR